MVAILENMTKEQLIELIVELKQIIRDNDTKFDKTLSEYDLLAQSHDNINRS